jgi:hypothetical protein
MNTAFSTFASPLHDSPVFGSFVFFLSIRAVWGRLTNAFDLQ